MEGSFSAVSKPIFARKYAFSSSRRDLAHAHSSADPRPQIFSRKNRRKFWKICRYELYFDIFQNIDILIFRLYLIFWKRKKSYLAPRNPTRRKAKAFLRPAKWRTNYVSTNWHLYWYNYWNVFEDCYRCIFCCWKFTLKSSWLV